MPLVTPDHTLSGAVLETYRARIHRHILSLVRNAGDAEDLTQETFLRAHQRLESLADPAALGAWLYRIATHVCYDFLRRVSRERAPERGEDDVEEEPRASGPSLDQLIERAEMSACGEELLGRIPESYRTVLLLHDLAGLTSVEIGRILGCAPGTVKIRLHRARARLKEAIEAGCDLYHDERGVLVGIRKPPGPGS